jgi:hypothetical protein
MKKSNFLALFLNVTGAQVSYDAPGKYEAICKMTVQQTVFIPEAELQIMETVHFTALIRPCQLVHTLTIP